MSNLRAMMQESDRFLVGVELVTTRGTLAEAGAIAARNLASELVSFAPVDWVSITDNAGGNPRLSPMSLGTPILYAGKEVLIHLSCKDLNRNGLESMAWQLTSEGFDNILALSGDYPCSGYGGDAKPVFDTDSVGLLAMLREMNDGLSIRPSSPAGASRKLSPTRFHLGTVTSPFKMLESELIPQYLKLEKKLAVGAEFIIAQIGYDTRKSHELKVYLDAQGCRDVPLIGNVFLLSPRIVELFHGGGIPGVVVSDSLRDECQRQASSADRGRSFFVELAARQVSVFRGLGYRGAYLGGVDSVEKIEQILNVADSFGPDDWRQFAREISYSRPGEFFLYAPDPGSGLVDPTRFNPEYEASLARGSKKQVSTAYRFSKWAHGVAFTPGKPIFRIAHKAYRASGDAANGPASLRVLERVSKSLMFGCKDCGDCSLPETGYLCPESACAKNQRNGPCGGSKDGRCEVHGAECIWARAYNRLKSDGVEKGLLAHAPVYQDQALRGTSSWANKILGRDHSAKHKKRGDSNNVG